MVVVMEDVFRQAVAEVIALADYNPGPLGVSDDTQAVCVVADRYTLDRHALLRAVSVTRRLRSKVTLAG